MTAEDIPYESLEEVYDLIAEAIDAVGAEHESAFFSKLVLTLAHMLDDPARFAQAVEIAKRNLDG
jgi:hypothetical protein